MPLSSNGLCEAEIITPRSARMRARQHGDGRRRHRAEQQHVHAHRGEAGDQGGFDHVAGKARILADDDAMAVVAAAEDEARRLATFIASSGVITPLARPRIPSVPKYLRAIFPHRQLPSGNIDCFGLKPASKNIQQCYRASNLRPPNPGKLVR